MGDDTPAAGGESKPDTNNNNNKQQQTRRKKGGNKSNKPHDQWQPSDSSLGTFRIHDNRREDITNFKKTMKTIVARATKLNSFAAQSISLGKKSLPEEPMKEDYGTVGADGKRTWDDLDAAKFSIDQKQWKADVRATEEALRQMYMATKGQCHPSLIATLKEDPGYVTMDLKMDMLTLLKKLESLAFKGATTTEPIYSLATMALGFLTHKQGSNTSLDKYSDTFNAIKGAADDLCGGGDGFLGCFNDVLIKIIAVEKDLQVSSLNDDQKKMFAKLGRNRLEAMLFMLNADQERYGEEIGQLIKDFLKGNGNFPKNTQAAYQLLRTVKTKGHPRNPRNPIPSDSGGSGDEVGHHFNNNGEEHPPCPRCGRTNHILEKCIAVKHADGHLLHTMDDSKVESTAFGDGEIEDPIISDSEVSDETDDNVIFCSVHSREELMFHQSVLPSSSSTHSNRAGGIPDTWILLDSQSSIDVFCNGELLKCTYKSSSTLTIRCNAGVRTTNFRGYLPGYGWIWYYPEGIANILSLSRVKERYRVTYDSATDNCFKVHKTNGEILNFVEASRRLYYFDTADRNVEQLLLLNSVEDNIKEFSAYDVDKARKAASLQIIVGRPSSADLRYYLNENMIPNCPTTTRDLGNAEYIWGKDLGSIKAKTVRRKPRQRQVSMGTNIPLTIMQQYRDVTLSTDIMKVVGIPFLMSISKHIKFGSGGRLLDMKNETILKHFKAIIGAYSIRGFRVKIVIADGQFESLRGDIADLGADLIIVARDEHVHDIERFIRTIKERVRADWIMMPFETGPPSLVAELVSRAIFWRNMFPLKTGISRTQSPGEIVLNRKLDFNTHCKVEPFQYVQTHEETDNTITTHRTVGAIATRPTGDGSYNFISLLTGRVLNRREYTVLPMPDEARDRMHTLARRARMAPTLTFTNRDNVDLDTLYADLDRDEDDLQLDALNAGVDVTHDDDEDDDDYVPEDEDESDSDDDNDDNDDNDDGYDDNDDAADNDGAEVTYDNDVTAAEDSAASAGVVDNVTEEEENEHADDEYLNGEEHDGDEITGVDSHLDAENVEQDNELTGEPEVTAAEDASTLRRSAREGRGTTSKFDDYVCTTTSEDSTEAVTVMSPSKFNKGVRGMSNKVNLISPRMFSRDAVNVATGMAQPKKTPRLNSTSVACNVFATCGDALMEDDQILLLTLNSTNDSGYDETIMARTEAEWMFLTQTLEWGEGLKDGCRDIERDEEFLFTTEQMNWKKGLKIFGEKGEDAIQKELQQIHDMEGFQPKHWYELTKEERADALKYLMYLKEKRDGQIKGRGCADGRKQRAYIPKAEASSPTATLMGIMLTCMIDAYEKREVATVDIPGAFLQTKMPADDRDVHVVLDGRMAELLAKISPDDYQKYVHQHRGQSQIYCKLNVSLYGTLKAALLFWKKLSGYLKDQGFHVNPYDWCVANKVIEGKTCTIVWHVDDLKISHVDSSVVDEVIESLRSEFGKVGDLTVNRGKVHDYLGMELDFTDEKSFTVSMEKYLDEVLKDLPEDMDGFAATPAADHLFKTRSDVAKLDEERAALFHRVTAQLLFASQRARPDLRTVVSFLTKRVQCPDEDDYKKLARAIKYVRRTKFLKLKVEANRLDKNHWFIDGAFAVHPDMKSHTGAYMTFGKGMVNGTSSAQKINTTSSTEAEVVAVHDNVPAILWTRYFMEAQGYPMEPSVVHQDNQSAMLLGTNGKGSSGKRTRHMNIRYFFVADVQERKHITMEYCPTDEMIGDFFTKPLQGAKFRRFRNIIMNITEDENGTVDVDELMKIHYDKMEAKNRHSNAESKDEQCSEQSTEDSQECVGRKIQDSEKMASYAEVVRSNL